MRPLTDTQDFCLYVALQCVFMKPRLLVTGGAGFLGSHILKKAQHLTASGTLYQTASTAIPNTTFHVCDLQQPGDVHTLLDRVRPEIIIHTACSDQGGNLTAIAPVAGLLAMQCAERLIRFIHLSTDQVFDGTAAPYTESSPTCPIHPYGAAKAEAETLVQTLYPQTTIVRTSLLYDLQVPDRHTQQLIQTTQTGQPYRLFTDEWRNPIWVENLAEALLELSRIESPGLLHMGGPQSINRWDFGMKLLTHFQVQPTPNIQQGLIEDSGLIRPKDLTLDSTPAQHLLQTPFLSLTESCKTFRSQNSHT